MCNLERFVLAADEFCRFALECWRVGCKPKSQSSSEPSTLKWGGLGKDHRHQALALPVLSS
jgi:hypothetical protein